MEIEGLTLRNPKIGDAVTIHSPLCEWDRETGEIVDIRANDDEMPYMVQRSNFDIWPFALHELELHSLDEAFEGGWIDPNIR